MGLAIQQSTKPLTLPQIGKARLAPTAGGKAAARILGVAVSYSAQGHPRPHLSTTTRRSGVARKGSDEY
jgi:hypothetical protein